MAEEFKLTKQYRNLCFVLNNYSEEEIIILRNMKFRYLIFGYEVGEKCGTPHLQGYIEFNSPVLGSTLKNKLNRVSWRPKYYKSSPSQAATYCKKGEQTKSEWEKFKAGGPNFGLNAKIEEFGNISQQGARNDIYEIINDLQENPKFRAKDLAVSDPFMFHQYGRTLITAETEIKRKITRESLKLTTEGVWYFGPTGCGKSHEAREICGDESRYDWSTNDDKWQDGYNQEDNIIIDDFRGGSMKYDDILKFIDKWNYSIPRRNMEPNQMISKRVIITSSIGPWDCFPRRNEKDSLAQLARRIKVFTREKQNDDWIEVTFDKWPKETTHVDPINTKDFLLKSSRLSAETYNPYK